jgi:ubiquitin carboxyl-terminal hydrolase 4/11/15
MELNYISTDMLWNLKTFQYEYDKSSALKVRNIFEQTAVEHWMGEKIDFDQLVLTVTSNYNQEDVTLDEPIKSLKKKLKFKKFYIRRLLPEEVIPTENKVGILIHESYR